MADHDLEREERAIYAIITAAAAPVVIAFAFRGGVFDGGTTLSFTLVVFGLAGLIAGARVVRRRRFPRARVIDRRDASLRR